MPIYEWDCEDCEISWEDMYDSYDAAPRKRKCPKCKKPRERLMSSFGAQFKGKGFYCNDYGKNSAAHANAKSACETFIKEAQVSSKERMETGFQNYKVYTPDLESLEQQGQVTRKRGKDTESIIHDSADRHRNTAKEFYKHSDIDPTKQKKTNVDLMTTPDKEGLE